MLTTPCESPPPSIICTTRSKPNSPVYHMGHHRLYVMSFVIIGIMPNTILMCKPESLTSDNGVDVERAQKQWQSLYDTYVRVLGWDVRLVEPTPGLSGMTFASHHALMLDSKIVLSRLTSPTQQAETDAYESWFRSAGYHDFYKPDFAFAGESEALIWNDALIVAKRPGNEAADYEAIADFLNVRLIELELSDPRYRLDTVLSVIDAQTITIYPPAFTEKSLDTLYVKVPDVIEADEADTFAYGLNAISDGEHIMMSDQVRGLREEYRTRSLVVHVTPLTEFHKRGASVKSLGLELRI
ncbi:MAG: amidinotransferase [Candidatus Saccharibacteria bacterium]|nr:amidinotransferase [Candidatus Saccharibacteria bacterium]